MLCMFTTIKYKQTSKNSPDHYVCLSGDHSPQVFRISACLISRDKPDHLLKDVCITNRLQRQCEGLLLEPKAGLLAVWYAKMMSYSGANVRQADCPIMKDSCCPRSRFPSCNAFHCMWRYHLVFSEVPLGMGAWGPSANTAVRNKVLCLSPEVSGLLPASMK